MSEKIISSEIDGINSQKQDPINDTSNDIKKKIDWTLSEEDIEEINTSSVYISLRYISTIFLTKINSIIDAKDEYDFYDEVIMFKMMNNKIQDIKSPFFINIARNDDEWYSYIENAQQILNEIVDENWELKEWYLKNEPRVKEWAKWLDFDVLTITDSWLLIFLNKKKWETTEEELEKYKDWIKEMVKTFREKLKS